MGKVFRKNTFWMCSPRSQEPSALSVHTVYPMDFRCHKNSLGALPGTRVGAYIYLMDYKFVPIPKHISTMFFLSFRDLTLLDRAHGPDRRLYGPDRVDGPETTTLSGSKITIGVISQVGPSRFRPGYINSQGFRG